MNALQLTALLLVGTSLSSVAQPPQLTPITARVSVQDEVAPPESIIQGEWVAVGTRKPHAISFDPTCPFHNAPSFRFELKEDDNTLAGYGRGDTKGRAELSYAYATAADVKHLSSERLNELVCAKKVYHEGKGQCPQASTMHYRFSLFVPSTLSPNVCTIFAQWHGMPDRTLVQTPAGEIQKISDNLFTELTKKMVFKKEKGYDKTLQCDAQGNALLDKKGDLLYQVEKQPNGWKVEQGGYPPLAFGFSDGYFYIKANSDRKWMSDKDERCNINPAKAAIGEVTRTTYKSSTLVYKSPFHAFPKEQWVTFYITVKWSGYNGEQQAITSPGSIDVKMEYEQDNLTVNDHIVKAHTIEVGRNDDAGYYFKFGIYRVGNSTEPVLYNLANYNEQRVE